MLELMPPPELITGVTNLINFFIAIVILFLIKKMNYLDKLKNKLWSLTFIFVALVGLLGAYLHAAVIDIFIYNTGWDILEVIMGLMVASLTVCSFYEKFGKKNINKIIGFNILAFAIYIIILIIFSRVISNNFIIFAVFAAINLTVDLFVFISIRKRNKYIKWFIAALAVMIIGSIIQALRFSFFIIIEIDSNSIYHIALSAALILAAIGYYKSENN